ncbi:MAG: glycosyltransferase family 1 protein [Oceanipulchritudo sp.]
MTPVRSLVINASPAFSPDPSGVGRYIISISRSLQKQASPFEHHFYYQKWTHRAFPSVDRELRIHRGPSLSRFFRPLARRLQKASGGRLSRSHDLYWEPNHIFEPSLRARTRILTVHDLSTLRFPEWHPPRRMAHFEAAFRKAVHAADHIVTVTGAIKRELQDLEGIDPGSVTVIPNGIDGNLFHHGKGCPDRTLPGNVRPGHFILFVGTIEPRKNLGLLVEAHQSLPGHLRREFPLVIAGGDGWSSEHLVQRIADDPSCIRAGFVDNEALSDLYRAATVMVYPSHYEGFGLPPLEAMACGCPVIASAIPAHREVLGEAALFCNPGDPVDLADRLDRLLQSPSLQDHCRKAGIQRARSFSWERSASDLLALFRKLAPGPDGG